MEFNNKIEYLEENNEIESSDEIEKTLDEINKLIEPIEKENKEFFELGLKIELKKKLYKNEIINF